MKYRIVVPVTPVAKARPRVGKHGNVYTPKKTQEFENTVRFFASKTIKRPLDGAVKLTVRFYFPRPKKLYWKNKDMPPVLHDKRPDISNLIKSVEDALNGIAYRDDAQIAVVHAEKWYHSGDDDDKPCVEIEVEKAL